MDNEFKPDRDPFEDLDRERDRGGRPDPSTDPSPPPPPEARRVAAATTPTIPPATTKEERTWAMGAHLSSLLAAWVGGLSLLGPLIVWLIKKDEMPFVDDQGKEALNFQILITLVVGILIFASIATCGAGLIATIPLIAVISIVDLIFVIIAAVKANEGVAYRYPFNWRIIK